MEQTQKKSRLLYWVLFAISLAGMIAFLQLKPEWVWVTFPFVGTTLALAMDAI